MEVGPGGGVIVPDEAGARVELRLAGVADAPHLWPDDDESSPLTMLATGQQEYKDRHKASQQDKPPSRRVRWQDNLRDQVAALLLRYPCDLLLIDTDALPALGVLEDITARPESVWCVASWRPGLYRGMEANSFDRLYQVERFWPDKWLAGLGIERCRSQAEKAGQPFVPYRSGEMPYREWQLRHYKQDRKLLPPIVNLDPAQVMTREEARSSLAQLFGCDPARPIGLVVGRSRGLSYLDAQAFNNWAVARFRANGIEKDTQVITLGTRLNGPQVYLPDLYRYLPGVDVFLGSCGYNSFYTIRYLRQLELFGGVAEFSPLTETGAKDQRWRHVNQAVLMSNERDCGTPVGNGADVLAEAIVRKASNLGWKFEGEGDAGAS
jgi:hypothetical protein